MDRKVMIAFDGSENSKDGLELGEQLCELFDAQPLVATAVEFPLYLLNPGDLTAAMSEATGPVLAEAKARLEPREVDTRMLLDQSPARAIQAVAEETQPLVIVAGSSHRGGIGRVFLGSVSRKLLDGSPVPVAIAPKGYAGRGKAISKICVAIDESEESERALEEAIAIARPSASRLTIVSVLRFPSEGYGSLSGYATEDFDVLQRQNTARLLEEAEKRVPIGIPVEIHRLEGNPAEELAKYSKSFDLMIMGSRGYGPIRRVMLGGVAAALINSAQCPLLVLPRQSAKENLIFDPITHADSFSE